MTWICRIIYDSYVLCLREPSVFGTIALSPGCPGMTGDQTDSLCTLNKWQCNVVEWTDQQRNCFCIYCNSGLPRLPQPSYRKHLPWRTTNLLVLNSQPQVCKPANPRQIISKINSFPEDLRGVGHSRIWFPMICLEQIGTSRTCNESQ